MICAPILEELGNHALCVILQREDTAEGDEDMHVVVGIAYPRHLHQTDEDEHGHNHQTDDKVGRDEYA